MSSGSVYHSNEGVAAFIEDLEKKAKSILRAAHNKQREEKRIQQSVAIMQGRKMKSKEGAREKEFVYVDRLNGNGSNNGSSSLGGSASSTSRALNFAVPTMTVTVNVDSNPTLLSESLPNSLSKPGYLSPIKSISKSAEFAGFSKSDDALLSSSAPAGLVSSEIGLTSSSNPSSVATIKRNFTLEKLQASPFLQGSESLDEMLVNLKKSRQPTSGGPGPTTESTWGLKIHAAEVLGGKHHATANKLHTKLLKKKKEVPADVSTEPSGLTDWTYKGLKSKYRSEKDREALWAAHQAAVEMAASAFENKDYMVPVVPVFRHPMILQYETLCKKVNWNSVMKTRKRLTTKRFVLDVREVWTTNLSHIREHAPENVLEAALTNEAEEYYDDRYAVTLGQNKISLESAETQAASGVDGGLSRRRDVKAILAVDHQVQSVAVVRATENAFFPTPLFDCKLVLDYEPVPTPYLVIPPPLPPVIEALISNFPIAMAMTEEEAYEHTMSRYFSAMRSTEKELPNAGPFAAGTNYNSGSKRAGINPATASLAASATSTTTRRSRIMMDCDVMININRLVPSGEMLSIVNSMYEQVRRMIGAPAPTSSKTKKLQAMHAHQQELLAHEAAHSRTHSPTGLIVNGASIDHVPLQTHNELLPSSLQHVMDDPVASQSTLDSAISGIESNIPVRVGSAVAPSLEKPPGFNDITLDPKDVDQALGDGSALEIWWRIEIIRRGDMNTVEYYAKESDVAAYVALMLQEPVPEPHPNSVNISKYVPLMVYETQSISLSSQDSATGQPLGLLLADLVISVSLKKPREVFISGDNNPDDTRIRDIIDIDIRALLNVSGEEIGCMTCAVEVSSVLDCKSIASNSYDWWVDPVRANDVWSVLTRSLIVEIDVASGTALLAFQKQQSPADIAPGGLSLSEALNCAHELTSLLKVDFDKTADTLRLSTVQPADNNDNNQIFLPLIRPKPLPPPPPPAPSILHHLAAAEAQAAMMTDNTKPAKKGGKKSTKSKKMPAAVAATEEPAEKVEFKSTLAQRSVKGNRRQWSDVCTPSRRSPEPLPLSSRNTPVSFDEVETEGLFHRADEVPWERQIQRNEPSLSIQVNGGLALTHSMPGACEMGVKGLWFKPPPRCPEEYTRAAAIYTRDTVHSTTASIIVLLCLALDTPALFPVSTAWEAFQTYPPRAQFEVIQDTVPALIAAGKILHTEPLKSPIDLRLSERVMIFSTAADEGFDYAPLDPIAAASKKPKSPIRQFRRVGQQGMKRQVPFMNELGYRLKVELYLLGINPVVNTNVFGLTKIGSQPNIPGTNARSIWHGTLALVEHINRPRVPTDYHYILVSYKTASENDACAFCVKLHGQEFVGLVPTASKAFQAEYAEIDERRAIFARQLALDAKIENSEMKMRIRDKEVMKSLQKEMQRAIEKKLRKGTRSERGWARRYHMSTLLEVQGEWERRRDDRSGMCFFHKIESVAQRVEMMAGATSTTGGAQSGKATAGLSAKAKFQSTKKPAQVKEKFLETCQWEVPSAWDGNIEFGEAKGIIGVHALQAALADLKAKTSGAGATNGSSGPASVTGDSLNADFMEPDDTWLPDREHIEVPTDTHGVAPRKFHRPTKKSMAHRLPKQFLNPDGSVREQREELYDDEDEDEGAENDEGSSLQSSQNRGFNGGAAAASAAVSINTARLEHIAEQLVSSDDLIRVLAKRLGLPVDNIVPAEDMSGVFSNAESNGGSMQGSFIDSIQSSQTGSGVGITPNYGGTSKKQPKGPVAPRATFLDDFSDPEADSDDDIWSDDEILAGDEDEDHAVDLPIHHGEMAALKRRDNKSSKTVTEPKKMKPGVFVPFLNLIDENLTSAGFEDNEGVVNWRRLPRATLDKTFFAKCVERRTVGPDTKAANTLNSPCALVPLSPVDAIQYVPDPFMAEFQSIFIPNAKKDAERQMATLARNINKESLLTENIPTDDLLLFGQPSENTKLDAVVMKQFKEDQTATQDVVAAAIDKALWAAKGGNISALEDALEEQIHVDTCDQFGNSLLLLAAQQGSKRMVKFLLRRGANLDWQNTSGNTAMHYCYAYNNASLGEYLKSRGANDALLNVDGMTCYEGLSKEYLKAPGDPESEEDEETAEQLGWNA